MPNFDSSATGKRMVYALGRLGYSVACIEHGLAVRITTTEDTVVVWLPEAHPAREYLWTYAGVDHRIPARYGWDSSVIAASIASSIPAPTGEAEIPRRNHNGHRTPARTVVCDRSCGAPYHDHHVYDAQGRRVAHMILVCRRCEKPAHYDTTIDAYQHNDPATPGCADSRFMQVSAQRVMI